MKLPSDAMYQINFSVLIKKYADPVHDNGITITELHDRFIPSMLEVIEEGKDSSYKKTLCDMTPVIEWVQIEDQYPDEPKEYGGGDGGKERFVLSVKINLITECQAIGKFKSEDELKSKLESQLSQRVEKICDDGCNLVDYSCDFELIGMTSYKLVKKIK